MTAQSDDAWGRVERLMQPRPAAALAAAGLAAVLAGFALTVQVTDQYPGAVATVDGTGLQVATMPTPDLDPWAVTGVEIDGTTLAAEPDGPAVMENGVLLVPLRTEEPLAADGAELEGTEATLVVGRRSLLEALVYG